MLFVNSKFAKASRNICQAHCKFEFSVCHFIFIYTQYTLQIDRPTDTDRWSRQMFRNMSSPLAVLIESDALIIIKWD